jgi:hypothetical protein
LNYSIQAERRRISSGGKPPFPTCESPTLIGILQQFDIFICLTLPSPRSIFAAIY